MHLNMFNSVLFFGRKNCNHSNHIKKILKNKSKNFYFIESSKTNQKINLDKFKDINFDYIFSFRSFYILKKDLLSKCKIAAINFHPGSPEFRGLGSINYALYNGSKFYGCTAHIIDEKIDNGKIIDVRKFKMNNSYNIEKALSETHNLMSKQAIFLINSLLDNKDNLQKLIKNNVKSKWSKKISDLKQLDKFYEISKNVSRIQLENKIRATDTKKYKPFIKIKDQKFILDENKSSFVDLLKININESNKSILDNIDRIKKAQYNPFLFLHKKKFTLLIPSHKKKLFIIGSGNHSKIILTEAIKLNKYECIGFIDEKLKKGKIITNIDGKDYKILGKINDIGNLIDKNIFGIIGIGLNFKRKQVAEIINNKYKNFNWAKIVSKDSLINGKVNIGEGSFIVSGSTINNGTTIGKHCLINTRSSIDHDNFFDNFSSTGPGVITGGVVKVGICSHIGIGAVIKQKILIGSNTLIGAKSLVLKNCDDFCVYYGSPSLKIKKRKTNTKYL